MRVWTIANQKGGAGKTTLAINLAVYAEQQGEMTLLVDIDPQRSCSVWQKVRGSNRPMVAEALPEKLGTIVETAQAHRISLVIVDTAPHSTQDLVTAIRFSDLIICPSQSSVLDLAAMRDTGKVLANCEAMGRAAAVLNNVPSKGADDTYKNAAGYFEQCGFKVAPTYVRSLRTFVRSLAIGQGVTEYDRGDNLAAQDIQKLWSYLNALSTKH